MPNQYNQPDRGKIKIRTNSKTEFPVMEIFGPTIQGEGMVIGQKTIFIRTGGCDFHCNWCDSAFTWNGTTEPEYITGPEAANRILKLAFNDKGQQICNHVTLTGGNPALIGEPMYEMIRELKKHGFKFGLETQGTRYQEWMKEVSDITLSPKPPSSGMRTNMKILEKIIERFNEEGLDWSFKIVIFDDVDLAYARNLFQEFSHLMRPVNYLSVGNANAYEEGKISDRLLEKLGWLWDKVYQDPAFNNVRPLPQLHTLVYDNKRGV